jgi:hypothetical protein
MCRNDLERLIFVGGRHPQIILKPLPAVSDEELEVVACAIHEAERYEDHEECAHSLDVSECPVCNWGFDPTGRGVL